MGMTHFDRRTRIFHKQVAKAAVWMQQNHSHDEHYWNWGVLTSSNKTDDPSRPIFEDHVAQRIFQRLEEKGLLKKTVIHDNGQTFSAYYMAYDKEGWDAVILSGHPIIGRLKQAKRDWLAILIIFILGLVIGVIHDEAVDAGKQLWNSVFPEKPNESEIESFRQI